MKSEKQFNADKKSLRKVFIQKRLDIENKEQKDYFVFNNLLKFDTYITADLILCYVALTNEISTDYIINHSISCGKKVAIPYCLDSNGNMEFYEISSLNDTTIGSYGIREPNIDICKKVFEFNNTMIITPGLSFDVNGNRLGYGKGYYDRFLEKHPLISVGLCYNAFVVDELPSDKFDKAIDYIITESEIIKCDRRKNG